MSLTNLSSLTSSGLSPVNTSVSTNASAVTANTASTAPLASTTYTPTPVSPSYTYDASGTQASPTAVAGLYWQNSSTDAISQVMGGNVSTGSLAGYYSGLGSALLSRYANTTSDYSQMVSTLPPKQLVWNPNQNLAGDVTLNITMQSGDTVALEIKSGDDGSLSVQAHSTGNLTQAEQTALASLAKGFQSAIDTMTNANSGDAAVNISGLLQYDPTVVSSLNLTVDLQTETTERTTLNFQENSSNRSINISGPNGNVNVNVDLTDLAAIGTQAQQKAAVSNYLQQFDQEEARDPNNTNTALMTAFTDSFTQLNSVYPSAVMPRFPVTPIVQTDQDHAMLTGLADFQASVSQTPKSPNPLKSTETDQFTYEMSQQTLVNGTDYANRSITQNQSSSLNASYHIWYARPDNAPPTTQLKAKQNYYYEQVSDSASATTNIGYQKGELTQASISKSASQSRHETKFSDENLVEDETIGVSNTETMDLMSILTPLQKDDPKDADKRAQILAAINSNVYLETDPGKLPFADALLKTTSALEPKASTASSMATSN